MFVVWTVDSSLNVLKTLRALAENQVQLDTVPQREEVLESLRDGLRAAFTKFGVYRSTFLIFFDQSQGLSRIRVLSE